MLYINSVFLVIIGLFRKQSKLIFYVMLFLLITLLAGNTDNGDIVEYMINYMNITDPSYIGAFEPGYQIFAKICAQLGLSYNQFLFVIGSVGLFLIVSTIRLFTPYISYVLSLYFIYPFLWDVVQVRNFLSMSIIIFGMRYIISNNKSYFKYIVCVFIASTFHTSALFYLLFLLIRTKNTRKLFNMSVAITAMSIIFMPKTLNLLSRFIPAVKILTYTETQTSMFTKLCVIGYYICLIILVKISVDIIKKENIRENKMLLNTNQYRDTDLAKKRRKIIELDIESILKINIVSMLGLYFFVNNLNFSRLYRNLYIIYYILFSICLVKMKKTKKYYIYYIIVLIFMIFSFVFFVIHIPTTKIITPIFENNIIFG